MPTHVFSNEDMLVQAQPCSNLTPTPSRFTQHIDLLTLMPAITLFNASAGPILIRGLPLGFQLFTLVDLNPADFFRGALGYK